jgi:hypothetical protein
VSVVGGRGPGGRTGDVAAVARSSDGEGRQVEGRAVGWTEGG